MSFEKFYQNTSHSLLLLMASAQLMVQPANASGAKEHTSTVVSFTELAEKYKETKPVTIRQLDVKTDSDTIFFRHPTGSHMFQNLQQNGGNIRRGALVGPRFAIDADQLESGKTYVFGPYLYKGRVSDAAQTIIFGNLPPNTNIIAHGWLFCTGAIGENCHIKVIQDQDPVLTKDRVHAERIRANPFFKAIDFNRLEPKMGESTQQKLYRLRYDLDMPAIAVTSKVKSGCVLETNGDIWMVDVEKGVTLQAGYGRTVGIGFDRFKNFGMRALETNRDIPKASSDDIRFSLDDIKTLEVQSPANKKTRKRKKKKNNGLTP